MLALVLLLRLAAGIAGYWCAEGNDYHDRGVGDSGDTSTYYNECYDSGGVGDLWDTSTFTTREQIQLPQPISLDRA